MDRGMGKPVGGGTGAPGGLSGASTSSRGPAGKLPNSDRPGPKHASAPKADRQVLEGYVKDGVVHLLEGELPDGIFVKVVRE
jgi:probable phosphoglycerate mutase